MSWPIAATLRRLLRRFRHRDTRTSQPKVRSLLRYTTVRSPDVREMTIDEFREWENECRQKNRQGNRGPRWLDRRVPKWNR